MKVGVLGSGDVGKVLAGGFLKHGHAVTLGTRTPERLKDWAENTSGAKIASFAEAAEFGDVIVLAVKGTAAAEVLGLAGARNLADKTVIDACNPIDDAPPEHGVLRFHTKMNQSLMEDLQRDFKDAHFVKAFNSVGSGRMVNPKFADGKPTMFLCGNNEAAKKTVAGICEQFGWEPADMGSAEAARAIESLCVLWCIPGFLRNEWTHAFKLLRK